MLSKENFVRICNKAVNESIHCTLRLNKEFLSVEPETWNSLNGYKAAIKRKLLQFMLSMTVNLATNFNLALTHDKEQRQLTFQVFENHRQNMALPLKKYFAEDE